MITNGKTSHCNRWLR